MKNMLLTVDQVAGMFNLHPKTVRRLIREGKITASKVGGQWRINEQEIKRFMGDGNRPDTQSDSMNDLPGFTSGTNGELSAYTTEKVQVSTVIDVFVENMEEAARLSNTFVAVLNCKDPDYGRAKYNFIYYDAEKKARFILWGTPVFISKMLSIVTEISK